MFFFLLRKFPQQLEVLLVAVCQLFRPYSDDRERLPDEDAYLVRPNEPWRRIEVLVGDRPVFCMLVDLRSGVTRKPSVFSVEAQLIGAGITKMPPVAAGGGPIQMIDTVELRSAGRALQ